MPAPSLIKSLGTAAAYDPMWFPTAEDDWHEYKSSLTSLADLARKLGAAASAFWNSGGGIFVAGLDGTGKPDGGIDTTINRQPLRDWVDQCLFKVTPHGPYDVRIFSDSNLQLQPGKGILVCTFDESTAAPHMAPDNKYYIRSGAHSNPAPSFVVEALFARRQVSSPLLRHFLQLNPQHGYTIQVGLLTASTAYALDVVIEVPHLSLVGGAKTFQVGAIGPQTPFVFDFAMASMNPKDHPPFDVNVSYRDAGGRAFSERIRVDVANQMGPIGADHTKERLLDRLGEISRSIHELRHVVEEHGQRARR